MPLLVCDLCGASADWVYFCPACGHEVCSFCFNSVASLCDTCCAFELEESEDADGS